MAGLHSIPVRFQGLQLIDKLTNFIDLFTNKNVTLHDRLVEMKRENEKLNNNNRRSLFASFKSVIGLNNIPTFPLTFDQLESQLKDISWMELSTEIDRIRSIFETNWSSLDIPIVLCLNNMKLNNFLFDTKNESISIIDFDHCSHNYCLIDIVSYFLELAKDDYETKYPHRNVQKIFLVEYLKYSKLNMSNIIYDPRGLLIAPIHLYWALWGFLQVLLVKPISTIDYLNYGKIRLGQYQRHKGNLFVPLNHSQRDFPKF
jgi:thiamine kinase-like enzyme